ncbi:hypothetical protein GGQ86_003694 [Xanthobacter flavus]|uniref:Uncharacterized protein n=1 Tax=Xanthobacter flavus TaxID=281 RepID=A0A9W6CKT3_XANFL|nr:MULTISPECIES: hypothetical protein [Xanthobacter]MBN8918822.1 hypothetical protein [Hyphomicrobiales bacterium]MDR6335199.1 hypothetical protein [Xanthobacter flavus]NMN58523.1 hypothetical protein [Xanthobacter sp. SG618]UDQ90567.1 hypothetical protein LJE71_06055 [Xanthobacter autotrophicus]GLI24253.1 hypothetical protein XFLAVUS301_39270 [Xanthobacter flavus]
MRVTVNPVDANGQRYSITLEKTSVDKGFIYIDPDGPKDVTIIKLYDIRASGAAAILCRGDVSGPDVTIVCRLVPAGEDTPPRLRVEISGSFFGMYDGIYDYGVTPEELESALAFLKAAAFPPVPANV